MDTSLLYVFVAVLYTECMAGITVNMIIVAANVKKWKTLKSLSTSDIVLIFLATSRILYLFSILFFVSFFLFYPQIFLHFVFVITLIVSVMLLSSTNLWFATVLCVLYCVKITSYGWKFFIFMKTKISTLVPWFLLFSLLISASSSLPFGWYSYSTKNLTYSSMDNLISFSDFFVPNYRNQVLIVFLGSCPPFMTFCVANLLLIQSLRMHTRRMKKSSRSILNLDSHLRAVKSMSLFLVLHLVYFVCLTIVLSGSLDHDQVWLLFSTAVTCFSPFVHSLYIICCSSDLQKVFISLFRSLKICTQEYR